jgi:triosephosphate isomerase
MKLPLILINFKAYRESVGNKGLKLAKICEKVSRKYKVNIVVAPQFADLKEICSQVKIPVFAQHIDAVEKPGSFTGHVVANNLKEIGVKGTLINHSERKLRLDEIKKRVKIAKGVGLLSVCCVPTIEVGKKVARFKPDFIAFEVPELIGSGRPISKERPDSVKRFVKALSKISPHSVPLCGAGISTGEDVKAALDIGTKGVLVASAVVKAKNPEKVLKEFVLAVK